MIMFVLITAAAFAETLLILAAAVAWTRGSPRENADAALAARWRSAATEALSAVIAPISRRVSAGRGTVRPRMRLLISEEPTASGASASSSGGLLRRLSRFWLDCAEGCLLGMVLGLICMQLGFELLLHSDDLMAYYGAAGVLLVLCGGRRVLRALVAVGCTILMLILYTPVSAVLVHRLDRSDTIRPAPAIVVLANTLFPDGTMNGSAQSRSLHAYSLLRKGLAPRVLVARYQPEKSLAAAIRAQMASLGLDYPVEETGVSDNTHDEALLTAEIARQRHWDTVILVTHPWHMRRAAATFEKAGVHVICSPCGEEEFDRLNVGMTYERLAAFRHWFHEILGYQTYKARGWL